MPAAMPAGRLIQGDEHCDTQGNSMCVAAQRVLLHSKVEFGQCVIERLRRTIQIIVFGSVGNLGQDDIHEVVFVAAALIPLDDIQRNLNGTL
jgi:hypothetical protein